MFCHISNLFRFFVGGELIKWGVKELKDNKVMGGRILGVHSLLYYLLISVGGVLSLLYYLIILVGGVLSILYYLTIICNWKLSGNTVLPINIILMDKCRNLILSKRVSNEVLNIFCAEDKPFENSGITWLVLPALHDSFNKPFCKYRCQKTPISAESKFRKED